MKEDRWLTYYDKSCIFFTHVISSKIAGSYLAYVMSEGFVPEDGPENDTIMHETGVAGGRLYSGAPRFKFAVGDKTLEIFSYLVADTGKEITTSKPRKLPTGETYYVLSGPMRCMIITEEEGRSLIKPLEKALTEARKQTEEYMNKVSAALKGNRNYESIPRAVDSA
jgi:hypothetical protein